MNPVGLGALLLAGAGQVPQVQETVTVTASRLPVEAAAPRRTVVLEREEIARLPVESVQELVAQLAGASLMRRGPLGAQADVMLRGATFEQVAVLVDGVRVNDPQTGHFNLDLAVDLDAVERIEVTLGPGSAVHGPDAFGGTVAITTAAPTALRARLGVGQHGLWQASAALPLGGGAWAAASRVSHDGYRPGTELDATRATLGWSGKAAGWGGAHHPRRRGQGVRGLGVLLVALPQPVGGDRHRAVDARRLASAGEGGPLGAGRGAPAPRPVRPRPGASRLVPQPALLALRLAAGDA
ncbi:MAG: TonB-dependent receptor [Thermoanaerobaculaceae bacterium]